MISKYFDFWIVTNSIGSITLALLVRYLIKLAECIELKQMQVDTLINKISNLEENIIGLEQKCEDFEDQVNKLKLSTMELQTPEETPNTKQLEEYLIYNYEFLK